MKLDFDSFNLSLMTKEAKKRLVIHTISTVCYHGLFYLLTMVMFWHVEKAAYELLQGVFSKNWS